MITVEELRYVLAVKQWNTEARKQFDASVFAPLMAKLPGVSAHRLFDTIDWFVALVQRETGVEISQSGIETVASLTRKRSDRRGRRLGAK